MPVIATFYGIIILMYFMDNRKHKKPHIHVKYGDKECVIEIPNGKILEGKLPSNKKKLIEAWIEIHKDELMANWELAKNGVNPERIDPLK